MLQLQEGTPPALVDSALKVIGEVDALVSRMKQLVEQYEQLREKFERLDREHRELRESEARIRGEHEEAAEALAELRAAYGALLAEYEIKTRALDEVGDDRNTLLREREETARDIRKVLDCLRS